MNEKLSNRLTDFLKNVKKLEEENFGLVKDKITAS